jgi:hypothetical protein
VYAPEIGEAINDDLRRFGVIKAGMYFPHASTAEAMHLAAQDPSAHNVVAFGSDGLNLTDPWRVVPIFGRAPVLEARWFATPGRAATALC